jgi:hypothetical protein
MMSEAIEWRAGRSDDPTRTRWFHSSNGRFDVTTVATATSYCGWRRKAAEPLGEQPNRREKRKQGSDEKRKQGLDRYQRCAKSRFGVLHGCHDLSSFSTKA